MVNNEQKIEILKAARREIEQEGTWCQGNYYNFQGGSCALGALATGFAQVTGNPFITAGELFLNDLMQDIVKHIPGIPVGVDPLSHSGVRIATYNDDTSTTQQDVLNLFDKTIAELGGMP